MSIDTAYRLLYTAALIVFAVLIGFVLIRSVFGPRITDRILCINMIGSMVISCIVILSFLLSEGYLLDVALIYAMISFVSVLVLASVYVPIRKKRANQLYGDPTGPSEGKDPFAGKEQEGGKSHDS